MKPLDPDIHQTGRWNFSGKNLPPDEIQALTDRGVNWDTDVMPDGRLKLPKFRKRRIQKILEAVKLDARILGERDIVRRAEYDSIPDPKPNYFEWAFRRDEQDHYARLEQEFYLAELPRDRVKALGLLLEFAKSKPKTTLELKDGDKQVAHLEATELLRLACEINNVDFEQFKQLLDNRATAQ